MPPKAADPPPGDNTDMSRYESQKAVRERVQHMLRRLWLHSDEVQVKQRAKSWAVDHSINECMSLVDMVFTPRQDSALYKESVASGSWEQDVEPETRPIDPWARAVIELRPPEEKTPVPVETSKPTGIRKSPKSPVDDGEEVAPPIRMWPIPKPEPRKLSKEEIERERRLLDDIETRRRAAELATKRKTKAEEEVALLSQLQKDLKGHEYGYDHRGAVCVYSRLDPERLPEQTVNPSSQQFAPPPAAADEEEGRTSRIASPVKVEPYIPTELVDGQAVVERFNLIGGVTVREGAFVKSGPKAKPDPDHLSQKEFLNIVGRDGSGEPPSTADGANDGAAPSDERDGGPSASSTVASASPTVSVVEPHWLLDAIPIEPQPAPAPPPDPNEVFVAAADWGIPAAARSQGAKATMFPRHASKTVQELALGKTLPKLPRDRAYRPPRVRSPALENETPRNRNPDQLLPPMRGA